MENRSKQAKTSSSSKDQPPFLLLRTVSSKGCINRSHPKSTLVQINQARKRPKNRTMENQNKQNKIKHHRPFRKLPLSVSSSEREREDASRGQGPVGRAGDAGWPPRNKKAFDISRKPASIPRPCGPTLIYMIRSDAHWDCARTWALDPTMSSSAKTQMARSPLHTVDY